MRRTLLIGFIASWVGAVTTAKTFASLYELSPALIGKLKDISIPKR